MAASRLWSSEARRVKAANFFFCFLAGLHSQRLDTDEVRNEGLVAGGGGSVDVGDGESLTGFVESNVFLEDGDGLVFLQDDLVVLVQVLAEACDGGALLLDAGVRVVLVEHVECCACCLVKGRQGERGVEQV